MSCVIPGGGGATREMRVRLDTEGSSEGKPRSHPAPPARRPHICFVALQAWPVFSRDPGIEVVGGAEVQQSIIARSLARAGYRVSMLCLDFGQAHRVTLDGVTVYKTYSLAAGVPALRFFHPRLTRTWRTLRAIDADVYYQRCAGSLTGIVAAFCRYYGRRSIFAAASDTDFIPGRQHVTYARDRWLFRRGLAAIDRIVVQNEFQRGNCRKYYGRDSVVIPSCYELAPSGRSRGGDIVLWVGNVRDYKRPEIFLDLARLLPEYRFVLVGGGGGDNEQNPGYFPQIRAAARALPNLEVTGFLPLAAVERYFDRARVVVNTSAHEGMPNTFLQAWARGIPTLAFSDVGARLRGEPLYRLPADTRAAAAEIRRLFCDAQYWTSVSARCQQYFETTHSVAHVVSHYEQLLDEVMRGHSRR